MRVPTSYLKTLADLSSPKLLAAYFVPFLGVTGFFALGLASNGFPTGVPLAQQEAELAAAFTLLAYSMAVGFPLLALVGVLCANTLAKEAERGSLRILLSKPARRWRLFAATFGAIVTYSGLVAVASLLLTAVMVVLWGGIPAAAIPTGIFAGMAGHVAYALFGASVVAALGLALAVFTSNRLRTALGALVVPALHFAFLPVRVFSGELYEEYGLYLVDVNYHFGNAFVFVHEAVGGGLSVRSQMNVGIWTGVYEVPTEEPERLPESLELAGFVPVEASVLLLTLLAVGTFAAGVYRFERMDV